MLTDERLDAYREAAKRWMSIDSWIARDLLDEIDRLRAALDSSSALVEGYERDVAQLRAARLRPETVEIVRRALDFYYGKSMELPPAFRGGDYDEVPVALADLSRAYPEEE